MSNAVQNELGSVVSLWRYPVKSMMGEELNATEVTERGLLGDRAYALVNQILSKALNREVTLGTAQREAGNAEEYWPDMDGLDHRDTVTDFTLPEETFFDCAMVHLLTTATLDRLRELYPQGRFEVRRFRPNIVVQLGSSEKSFAENAWVGHTLVIGTAGAPERHQPVRALCDDHSRAGGSLEGSGNPAHGGPA